MNNEQKEKATSIIRTAAGKDDSFEITETTTLDELEIDAGELATIDSKLEVEFNVVLPDDAVAKCETVGDIFELLNLKLEAQ